MNDPCDALSTATIDGQLFYMIGNADFGRTIPISTDDPCDDWPVLLIPGVVADLVTAIFKQALDRTVFRDVFKVDLVSYLATVDMAKACQPYQRVFTDGGTFTPLGDLIAIDPYYRSANCDHDWQPGAEGEFAGLTEHCDKCGLER